MKLLGNRKTKVFGRVIPTILLVVAVASASLVGGSILGYLFLSSTGGYEVLEGVTVEFDVNDNCSEATNWTTTQPDLSLYPGEDTRLCIKLSSASDEDIGYGAEVIATEEGVITLEAGAWLVPAEGSDEFALLFEIPYDHVPISDGTVELNFYREEPA